MAALFSISKLDLLEESSGKQQGQLKVAGERMKAGCCGLAAACSQASCSWPLTVLHRMDENLKNKM